MKKLWSLLLAWICLYSATLCSKSSNNVVGRLKANDQKTRTNLRTIKNDASDSRRTPLQHFALGLAGIDKIFDEESLRFRTTKVVHNIENVVREKHRILASEITQNLTKSPQYGTPISAAKKRPRIKISWPKDGNRVTQIVKEITPTKYESMTFERPKRFSSTKAGRDSLEQKISPHDIVAPLSTKKQKTISINKKLVLKQGLNKGKCFNKQMKQVPKSSTKKLTRILRREKRSSTGAKELKCLQDHASCQGRCLRNRDFGAMIPKSRCGCDPFCGYFRDCCHDYVKHCHNGNTTNASKAATNPGEKWSCRNQTWMISSCPDTWKDIDIKTSCTRNNQMTYKNYADVLPVMSPDNRTFANRFCARCHGVQENQLKWYQLNIKCSIAPPVHSNLKNKIRFIFQYCKVTGQAPTGIPRRYCYDAIKNCSVKTKHDVKDKCIKGNYGLVVNHLTSKLYRNLHCALCNRDTSLVCGPSIYFSKFKNPSAFPDTAKSLSITMRITEKEPTIQTYTCSKGKVYDVYSEVCRVSLTVPDVSHPELIKYRVLVWLRADDMMNIRKSPFKKDTLVNYLTQALSVNTSSFSAVTLKLLEPYLLLVEFELKLSNLNNSAHNTVLDELAVLSGTRLNIDLFNGTVVKVTVKPLTCATADTYTPSQYQVIPGQSSVFINLTGEVLHQKDYFCTNMTMFHGYPQPVGPIVVCRLLLSGNCSGAYIFLEKQEYVMYSDRSLKYTTEGRIYKYKEYTIKNGSVIICTNFNQTYKKYRSPLHDRALSVITYIGFSISIVCLFLVLITYSLFAKLRTIPGINLMNLSSALLVAHLLWLVGSGQTADWKICTGIAVVLHYSFLASFMWMSIIAFETWKTFSKLTLRSKSKKGISKHTIITMTIGWIPLAVFVSACVALDQSDVVTIGYGGEKGCWINNPWANLLIFALPVAVSLILNAVFFAMIIRQYVVMRNRCKLVFTHHRCRQDCTIFARIAASMGFSWVFGFLAPVTTMYLLYPFVIFNTLQGLFIAVSFLCTRKVKQMYKELWAKNAVYTL